MKHLACSLTLEVWEQMVFDKWSCMHPQTLKCVSTKSYISLQTKNSKHSSIMFAEPLHGIIFLTEKAKRDIFQGKEKKNEDL